MAEQQLNKNQLSESDKIKVDELEIDLVGIIHKIINNRKIFYKSAGIGLVIGIIISISIPKQYTVCVTLSPEIGGNQSGNGLAGLAASFLGGSTVSSNEGNGALNVSLSSDIVASTPFLRELLAINVPTSEGELITLDTYLDRQSSPWWSYVIGLPGIITGGLKSLFMNEVEVTSRKVKQITPIELSQTESAKINMLRQSVIADINKKTGITNVAVTLQNPKIAAVVADSVVYKLQEYIISYRISKAKEDCTYLEELFKDRKKEYYIAQKNYADYVDTHDNVILQNVRLEQERLQNDMNLAYQIYSQVANQLQVARAKVQEDKPVFAVVEPAVVPLRASGMGTIMYVILFVLLSVICSICWVVIGNFFRNSLKDKNSK